MTIVHRQSREQSHESSELFPRKNVNTKWRPVGQTCKSMNFLQRKRAAACFLAIDLLEECTENESEGSWWKRGQTREWIKRRNESGMQKLVEELQVEDSAAYNETFRINCETFEEILTGIGPVITKTADRKTIMTIIREVKREKLPSTIMKNLNKLKMNDS